MTRPIALRRPLLIAPGFVLCTCKHERREHGPHGCRGVVAGAWHRRRRCPCLRFVEAPFKAQQTEMFA